VVRSQIFFRAAPLSMVMMENYFEDFISSYLAYFKDHYWNG